MKKQIVGYIPRAFIRDHTLDMNGIEHCLNRGTGQTTARCLGAISNAILNPGIFIEISADRAPGIASECTNIAHLRGKERFLKQLISKLGLEHTHTKIKDGRVYVMCNHVVPVYKETKVTYEIGE